VVTVLGPVTLGTTPVLDEVVMAVTTIDGAVWSGNDTSGQADKSAARAGGRATVSWSQDDLGGALLPCAPSSTHNNMCALSGSNLAELWLSIRSRQRSLQHGVW
jgi:hypothetical protein